MAICGYCKKEMMESPDTCTGNHEVEFPDGEKLPSIPYYYDEDPGRRCHDCNVAVGGFHHPGCDMERCPLCGGQLISCGCLDTEDEEDEEWGENGDLLVCGEGDEEDEDDGELT